MLIRFNGFKMPPIRDHIVIDTKGGFKVVGVGESIDLCEEDAYKLRATGEWESVEEADTAKPPRGPRAPVTENRAILDKGENNAT